MAYDVDTVSCDEEHDGEVFANFRMASGSYPGDSAITEAADDKCYTLQYAYAMDTWAIPENVDIYYFTPTRDSWSLGDREISCLFGNVDEKGGLTGSLRQDETTLDADQLTYLKAAQVLNEAMESAPEEEYVEDDLPGHKEWATRVSAAITEQLGMLRGHDWPADAKDPVAALVKDLDKAQGSGRQRRSPPTRTSSTSTTTRRWNSPTPRRRSPRARLWASPRRRRSRTRATAVRTAVREAAQEVAAQRCDGGHNGEKVPA